MNFRFGTRRRSVTADDTLPPETLRTVQERHWSIASPGIFRTVANQRKRCATCHLSRESDLPEGGQLEPDERTDPRGGRATTGVPAL